MSSQKLRCSFSWSIALCLVGLVSFRATNGCSSLGTSADLFSAEKVDVEEGKEDGARIFDVNNLKDPIPHQRQSNSSLPELPDMLTQNRLNNYFDISDYLPLAPGMYDGCGHSVYWNSDGRRRNGDNMARITGGMDARENEFPHQARIMLKHDSRQSICGASIINETFALTAAHCCESNHINSPDDILLVVGDHNKTKLDVGELNVTVLEMIVHPKYTEVTHDLDFCLLRLKTPLKWNRYVQPICLPETCKDTCSTNEMTIITGWGAVNQENVAKKVTPDILQKALVPIVDDEKCRKNYLAGSSKITNKMLCAGYDFGKIDSCQGDSGGPLVCYKNGFYQLDGVTSFGIGCGERHFYGVYAKVCKALDWIRDEMKTSDFGNAPPMRGLVDPEPPKKTTLKTSTATTVEPATKKAKATTPHQLVQAKDNVRATATSTRNLTMTNLTTQPSSSKAPSMTPKVVTKATPIKMDPVTKSSTSSTTTTSKSTPITTSAPTSRRRLVTSTPASYT